MKIKRSFYIKFYTIFVALIPILFSYASFLPGISLAEFILIILVMLSIFDTKYVKKSKREYIVNLIFIVFIIYSILNSTINCIFETTPNFSIISRTIRFVFNLVCIILLEYKYLDESLFINYTEKIGTLCGIFVIIQYLAFSLFGKIIQGKIPFLKLTIEGYGQIVNSNFFRPSGFFVEPSILVWYLFPIVIYKLFCEKDNLKKGFSLSLFYTVIILMSKSLFGILLSGIIWAFYIIYMFFIKREKSFIFNLFLFLFVPIIAYFLVTSDIVQHALTRIDFTDISSSPSFSGRFLQYDLYNTFSTSQKLFGVGIGNWSKDLVLSNSVSYIISGNGIVGIILFFLCFIYYFFNTKLKCTKIYIICLFIIAFGSNTFLSCFILYLYSYFKLFKKMEVI